MPSVAGDNNSDQFGMTAEEVKSAKRNDSILKLKQIFAAIEPVFIKVFNTVIYYTVRLIKAFVSASMRMIMGKEV